MHYLRLISWIVTGLLICKASANTTVRYTPDWDSLDSRALPKWYDEARIGIFVHWGVFSVPSYVSEWFWQYWKQVPPNPSIWTYMHTYYRSGFAYSDFAQEFRAEFFNPDQWADIFEKSGAKYVVLTTKHHEGYCNWPSESSWNWNSVDVGPRRDLVGDLAKSIRKKKDLKFGIYHSLFEWFNPMYLADKASGFKEQNFPDKKTLPELYDLIKTYLPSVIWSDGDEAATSDYWRSKEFLAWLYNDSPVKDEIVVNDRWGSDADCKHGDYLTCKDRYRPGKLLNRKWEMCQSIDRYSWGYRRESRLTDYLTPEEIIISLVDTVAFGGNFLINVGPTSWGTISPIFEERLLIMGDWLRINGEAIYSTIPWKYQNDDLRPATWYLQHRLSENVQYVVFLQWTAGDNQTLRLAKVKPIGEKSKFTLIDGDKGIPLTYSTDPKNGTVVINLPTNQPSGTFIAWAVRMESIQPN